MRIAQNKIDEVSASADIVDIISAYTPLRKAGRNFMGRCPFHQEKTPSFSVSQEKGVYHCFGCGKSGNVFTFLMEMDNISFFDAVKTLAEKEGIALELTEEYDDRNRIEILYEIHKKAGLFFHNQLNSNEGKFARNYLQKRKINDSTITQFGIGYSPKKKDSLYKNLINEFSKEDIIASGLVLQISSNEFKDRFRGRLMFPIFSESSRVIAFGGRKLYEDDGIEAKYVNSPETGIYYKSKVLYGLNFAREFIKQQGYAILVEGYMDAIALFQQGIENVVASSGTSLTDLQVKTIERYTKEIVILYDSDQAGQAASRRAIEIILQHDLIPEVISLPENEDPDSIIQKKGKAEFENLLTNRVHFIYYIAEKYKEAGKLENPEGKSELIHELIRLISKIKDEVKKNYYLKDISEKYEIYESVLRRELKTTHKENENSTSIYEPKSEIVAEKIIEEAVSNEELVLLKLFIDSDSETKDYLRENLEADIIPNSQIKKIVNYIIMNSDEEKTTPSALMNKFSDEITRELIGKILLNEGVLSIQKTSNVLEAERVLAALKKKYLEKKIEKIMSELKQNSENSKATEKLSSELLKLKREKIDLSRAKKV